MIPHPLPDIPSSIVVSDNRLYIEISDAGEYTLLLDTPNKSRLSLLQTYDYSDLYAAHQKEIARLNNNFPRNLSPYDIPQ